MSPAIVGLVVSPGHNYWFHSHDPADGVGPHPTTYPDQVEVVAGQGIVGDRFFGRATRLAAAVSSWPRRRCRRSRRTSGSRPAPSTRA